MCRAAWCNGGRRCLAHNPEARSAGRSEDAMTRATEKVKDYLEQLSKKTSAGEKEAPPYSIWRAMLHKLMKAATEAAEVLTAKRQALRVVRAEHAAERLAAVRSEERREKAAAAVAEVERRITESEAAIDALRMAQDDEVRTRVHEDWPTPKGMAGDLWLDAISERAECEKQLQDAEAQLGAADDRPDPKTGGPTKAKEKWQAAKKRFEFSIRHEARMKECFDRTPTHEDAIEALAAAEARCEAARTALAEAKKTQETLLTTGRPAVGVSPVTEIAA